MTRSILLACALLSVSLVACGGDDVEPAPLTASGGASSSGTGGEGGTGGTGGTGASGPVTVDLSWSPCPLFSDGTGPEAECATPDLPLRATDPTGPTLQYFVKRFARPDSPRTKQLWMLAGGPGFSSIIYEGAAEALTEIDPTLEVYLPDHRGTGDSSRIGCPEQESDDSTFGFFIAPPEWKNCMEAVVAEWGADLDAFTVTNAAHDVGVLIESTKREDASVIVHGGSYGTFWAQRYMQLFPDQADGVILDAIAPPDASLARQDIDADEASFDLFQACTDDPACGPKLGGDPRAFAVDLYSRLDDGHCFALQGMGPPRILLRRAFGQMMMGWNGRRLIPATLARVDRCAPEDVDAVSTLIDFYFGGGGSDLPLREYSFPLAYGIVFSELWETPEITVEQMAQWREDAVVSRDITEPMSAALPHVPRYPHDEHWLGFADTDVPILMLQGTWDPATRPGPAEALKDVFSGEHQHWIEIPRGAHGALFSIPTNAGDSCGLQIVMSFLQDPQAPPDVACLDDLAAFTFDGTPQLNQLLFGTDDAWGGI